MYIIRPNRFPRFQMRPASFTYISQRVLAKVGFEREGYARDYLEIAGRREDHILFALVRPAMPR